MRWSLLASLALFAAVVEARLGGMRPRPKQALAPLNASEEARVFERRTERVRVGGGRAFACEGDAFNVSVVHMVEDEWRMRRFARAVEAAGYDVGVEIWPGFVVRDHVEEYEHYVRRGLIDAPKAKKSFGNVGAALAHLSLWEALLRRRAALSLVLEDDATFEAETLGRLCALLRDLRGGFDYVNLAALRPRGSPVPGLPGVFAVEKAVVGEPMPNVVMSAYAVTAAGLEKLLACFRRRRPDVSGFHRAGVMDRFLSQFCLSRGPLRAFVVDARDATARVFGHNNTGLKSARKSFNVIGGPSGATLPG